MHTGQHPVNSEVDSEMSSEPWSQLQPFKEQCVSDSQIQKQTCGYQREEGSGEEQIRNIGLTNYYYGIDKQYEYTVQYRELYPCSCNNL